MNECKYLQRFLLKVTKVIKVDVNRTDDYTENGLDAQPFKTIQAAIDAATSGTILDIMPGTYDENITLKPGVYLKSKLGLQPGVMITGKVSWSSGAGTILMNGICVFNDSDHAIDFGGTGVQKLRGYDCKFETNSEGAHHSIKHSNTNVGSEIFLKDSLVQIRDSSGGAKAIETAITSQGSIGLDNTTVRIIDNLDNVAVNLKGAIAYWQRMDEIRGRVIVADLASCNISLDGMYANELSCLETNSAGLSILSSVILSSTASPIVTGAGAFAFSQIGYSSTGQGLAGTLNGGLGAAIGAIPGESADGIIYDNTISGLNANRVKTALDELALAPGGKTHSPWFLGVFRTSGVIFPNNDDGFCHIGGAGTITSTEALAQIRMPKGRVEAIQGYCSGGSGDFTVRKNGVATTLTGTVNSVGQFYLTGVGAVEFADGDLISLYYNSGVNWTVYGIQIAYKTELI